MNDQELLRYSRQILVQDVDIKGQEKLLSSKALIIGAGGLGSPVILYLAAAGIGSLTIVDFDHVELSNLQRQIMHSTQDIGLDKVASAKASAKAINPTITIQTINYKLNPKELLKLVDKHDVVVDCTDNFTTRFEINQACVTTSKPLVSGAAIRMEGQITTFDLSQVNAPCYRCLYQEEGEIDDTCSNNGVLSSVVGIIGSIQSTEVLKIILGLPTLNGRLLLLDAKYMEWQSINQKQDPQCPVCSQSKKHTRG